MAYRIGYGRAMRTAPVGPLRSSVLWRTASCGPLGVAAIAALAAAVLGGCRGNSCFLKVCQGKDCRCSISSCSEGAAFDIEQNRCRCLKGYLAIAGQCLTPRDADAYCGAGHHFENGGCAVDRCRPGDEIDQSTGWCVPREQVNRVATTLGVPLGAGQQLGCPVGQKLIVDGPTAACVPLAQTCARDETWTGQACAKVAPCPTGAIWDPTLAQCIQYAQGSGSNELVVNVSQWAFANYGPNGGSGTSAFCGAFAKRPLSFGLAEGSSAMVRISVMMAFEGGEISRGAVQTSAVFDGSGNPVPQKGAGEIDVAAKRIFSTLLLGGGRASTPTAATTVKCAVVNAARPQPVPSVGGL